MARRPEMGFGIMLMLALVLSACGIGPDQVGREVSDVSLRLAEPQAPPDFARATGVQDFVFPDDHGPHFAFQTEWWYYTGNLQTDDGRRFGYQFTIFRRALAPGAAPVEEGLKTNQVYFAHIALTDVSAERHYFDERFSRGAAGLAGAQAEPFSVWVEDWRAVALDSRAENVRIQAAAQDFELSLELTAEKPIVKHGRDGLSAKSDDVGNASYYLSYTRMRTNGEIQVAGQSYDVSGSSWFDHEWSTSVLGEGAVGWDWFSLQLDDGRELMLYYIRNADGSIDPVSGGTYVAVDGIARSLSAPQIQIESLDTWTSAESGAVYPSGWSINIPDLEMSLNVEPLVKGQEMRVSFTYWEGAVGVSGTQAGKTLSGSGFVELTGYLESMEGVLS